MDKEKIMEALRSEGFPVVFAWTDEPNVKYDKHTHGDRVSIWVLSGSIGFDLNGEKKSHVEVKAGDRFDVPPKLEHKQIIGDLGAEYVVAAMQESDS